jgi:hypothetical protein
VGIQRPGVKLANTFIEWTGRRPTYSESRAAIEEAFLWGYQTAQLSAGVAKDDPAFVVEAGMYFNTGFTRVLGWHLTKKNGSTESLLFKDAIGNVMTRPQRLLSPVIKKKKRRKRV